jgi:hypothetical protein
MQLLITTQYQENYGAHDWDGEGECPQYWKMKGGKDYRYDLGAGHRSEEAITALVMALRPQIERSNEYIRYNITGWEVVADSYLTDYERSQLEYEGVINYPATRLTLETVCY